MKNGEERWKGIDSTIEEIALAKEKDLLKLGRRIVPTLTPEDMLQPNDYPELDNHPEFRYEEGVIAGIRTVQMALRALGREG